MSDDKTKRDTDSEVTIPNFPVKNGVDQIETFSIREATQQSSLILDFAATIDVSGRMKDLTIKSEIIIDDDELSTTKYFLSREEDDLSLQDWLKVAIDLGFDNKAAIEIAPNLKKRAIRVTSKDQERDIIKILIEKSTEKEWLLLICKGDVSIINHENGEELTIVKKHCLLPLTQDYPNQVIAGLKGVLFVPLSIGLLEVLIKSKSKACIIFNVADTSMLEKFTGLESANSARDEALAKYEKIRLDVIYLVKVNKLLVKFKQDVFKHINILAEVCKVLYGQADVLEPNNFRAKILQALNEFGKSISISYNRLKTKKRSK